MAVVSTVLAGYSSMATESTDIFNSEEITDLIDKYIESETDEDLKVILSKIIETANVVSEDESLTLERNDMIADLVSMIESAAEPTGDEDPNVLEQIRDEKLIEIAKVYINLVEKSMSKSDFDFVFNILKKLPEGEEKSQLAKKLKELEDKINESAGEGEIILENSIPLEWMDNLPDSSFVNPNEGWVDDGFIAGYPEGITDGDSPIEVIPLPTNAKYSYVMEGGKCYRTTTYTDGSKPQIKELVKKGEEGLCPVNPTSIGKPVYYPSYGPGMTSSKNPGGYGDSENIYGKENESGITVHFAYQKSDNIEDFIDTGIRLEDAKYINYEQLKETFSQISSGMGVKIFFDKNAFLIPLEGKIIVVRNTSKPVAISEVEKSLSGVEISVKAFDTRIGKK